MRPWWHQHLPRKHPPIYQTRITWNGIDVNLSTLTVTTDFKDEKNWLDVQLLTSLEIRQGVHQAAQLCELATTDYLAAFNFFIWLSSKDKKEKKVEKKKNEVQDREWLSSTLQRESSLPQQPSASSSSCMEAGRTRIPL